MVVSDETSASFGVNNLLSATLPVIVVPAPVTFSSVMVSARSLFAQRYSNEPAMSMGVLMLRRMGLSFRNMANRLRFTPLASTRPTDFPPGRAPTSDSRETRPVTVNVVSALSFGIAPYSLNPSCTPSFFMVAVTCRSVTVRDASAPKLSSNTNSPSEMEISSPSIGVVKSEGCAPCENISEMFRMPAAPRLIAILGLSSRMRFTTTLR